MVAPRRSLLVVLAALACLGGVGCADDENGADEGASGTAFGQALGEVGTVLDPEATGFGWIDLAALREPGADLTLEDAAAALGPGADELVVEPGLRSKLGIDVSNADEALSAGGSITFGVRLRPVDAERVQAAAEAEATGRRRVGGARVFELLPPGSAQTSGALRPLGPFGARLAVSGDSLVVGRSDLGVEELLDPSADATQADPRLALAVECLGDVSAARTFPAEYTHNPPASPQLLAVGIDRESSDREVFCAINDDRARTEEMTRALSAALLPSARDAITGRHISDDVANALVTTEEGDGVYAARAEIDLAPRAPRDYLFGALTTGALITFTGAEPPRAGPPDF